MKPDTFIIRIPEPCHEDWDQMKPDEQGKFCKACCKSVYDFSKKTPGEISQIFRQHASEKICGFFKQTQLDRPLPAKPTHRSMTVIAKFAFAIYLVFGSLLFSCKTLPEPEQKTVSSEDWQYYLFTKGKTRVVHAESDSARNVYGKADYMRYLTEELTDTTLHRAE